VFNFTFRPRRRYKVSKFWLDPELAQIVMHTAGRTNTLYKFTAAANDVTATAVVLHLEHVIYTIKIK